MSFGGTEVGHCNFEYVQNVYYTFFACIFQNWGWKLKGAVLTRKLGDQCERHKNHDRWGDGKNIFLPPLCHYVQLMSSVDEPSLASFHLSTTILFSLKMNDVYCLCGESTGRLSLYNGNRRMVLLLF